MSLITPHVVAYCAQECEWQGSGEMSVFHMVEAWRYAHRHRNQPIRLNHILALGRLVEPVKNANGMRRVGVRVGYDIKMEAHLVPDALSTLLAQQDSGPAQARHRFDEAMTTEWFRQYEEIHPFIDGNGRTGTLLWNWLRGTLHHPAHVPNLWNDPRR
jgi:hypothetical protein